MERGERVTGLSAERLEKRIMRRPSTALFAVLSTVVASAPGVAQQAKGRAAPARVAGITPSPPVAAVPGTSLVLTAPANTGGPPVVLLPDGRLFANFGRGYEQVAQPCGFTPYVDDGYGAYGTELPVVQAQPQSGAVQPVVVQPTVTQPSAGAPSTLPVVSVPLMPAPAILMPSLPPQVASQVTTLGQPVVNPQACWAHDRRGRILVAVP